MLPSWGLSAALQASDKRVHCISHDRDAVLTSASCWAEVRGPSMHRPCWVWLARLLTAASRSASLGLHHVAKGSRACSPPCSGTVSSATWNVQPKTRPLKNLGASDVGASVPPAVQREEGGGRGEEGSRGQLSHGPLPGILHAGGLWQQLCPPRHRCTPGCLASLVTNACLGACSDTVCAGATAWWWMSVALSSLVTRQLVGACHKALFPPFPQVPWRAGTVQWAGCMRKTEIRPVLAEHAAVLRQAGPRMWPQLGARSCTPSTSSTTDPRTSPWPLLAMWIRPG